MTTTYWILAAVAYIASCCVAAWLMIDPHLDPESDSRAADFILRSFSWPVFLLGWLASKLRKENHDA